MTEPINIVITDGHTLNPDGLNPFDEFAQLGQVRIYDKTDPGQLLERAAAAHILVVNKTKVRQEQLAQLPKLKFIAVTATGYDCVDVSYAAQRGILVANVPVYGTDTVAEYVFSAIMHLAHNISVHDAAVHAGQWAQNGHWSFWKTPLWELKGKTLGIVGWGRIGCRVGELGHAFGMPILAHDLNQEAPPPYQPFAWAALDELFARADIISLHCPQNAGNYQFVNAGLLKSMRPTAYLINAARGTLINEADLAEALNAGILAGAVLDVVSEEPITADNPLLHARNAVLTPHLAWAALEARQRLSRQAYLNIKAFLDKAPINVVNADL